MGEKDPGTQTLVERVKAGDQAAKNLLVLRDREALKRHILKRAGPSVLREATPTEIADMVHVRALESIQEFESRGKGSWLAFVLRKAEWAILDLAKGLKRKLRDKQRSTAFENEHEMPVASTAGAATKADRKDQAERLQRVMSTLAADEREILSLRFFDALSIQVIAERLRLPKSTVFDRLNHAAESFGREWRRGNSRDTASRE